MAGFRVEGDEALAAGLAKAQKDTRRALSAANRTVGRTARDWIRADAKAGTRRQAKMAGGIGSSATSSLARITVRNTTRAPGATPTFYGTKGRTGWYLRRDQGRPQHPPWVGADWTVATRGEGPYVINETLARRLPEIEQLYLDGQAKVLFDAVPTRPRG